MKISYVIPCYRSEKTIEGVISEIEDVMSTIQKYSFECILVNDCSPDNTLDVLKLLVQTKPNISVIDFARNFGQHAALMAGLNASTGDFVICLDDDGQIAINEVEKLIQALETGSDAVIAEYDKKKEAYFRLLGSKINDIMANLLIGKPKDMYLSSFWGGKRIIIDQITSYKGPYPYIQGLLLRSTNNVSNVIVSHRERSIGESGYTFRKLLSLWLNGFTSFSVKPLRFASYCGLFSSLFGFVLTICIVLKALMFGSVPGWPSLMATLLILAGLILIVLGLIGEYVGRIYMCINSSPQYVIRQTFVSKPKY